MTSKTQGNGHELMLTGLDGSNPLAFLAALGTLRTLALAWPDEAVKMRWKLHAGAWRPAVQSERPETEEGLTHALTRQLHHMAANPALELGDNLNVSADTFRSYANELLEKAQTSPDAAERISLGFAAAFACDALVNEQAKVQDTALRTMSGAGHQHFLATMRFIAANTQAEHLGKVLFRPWKYDDPIAKQSLRWDPSEDSRYALQWRDPSGDPTRNRRGTMLGANRLAIEAVPLLACAPDGKTLRTVGFKGRGARDTYWTWPIWDAPISLDVCRSLLANPSIQEGGHAAISSLKSMGVQSLFRSRRITTGKFRNFTPADALF